MNMGVSYVLAETQFADDSGMRVHACFSGVGGFFKII
jgi:hypothetical protein